MKRSEINYAIAHAKEVLEQNHIRLPFFGYWTMEDWKAHREEIHSIVEVMQGWDVSDFGSEDFYRIGAVLFTLRNGKLGDSSVGTPYAEKLMVLTDEKEQEIPLHCHLTKTEDIILRSTGIMSIQLFASKPDHTLDPAGDVVVYTDGIRRVLPGGTTLDITQGNSITLTPGLYHRFYAKKGCGDIVAGEVSSINDDHTDNLFFQPSQRFIGVIEDEPILHPLANDYGAIMG